MFEASIGVLSLLRSTRCRNRFFGVLNISLSDFMYEIISTHGTWLHQNYITQILHMFDTPNIFNFQLLHSSIHEKWLFNDEVLECMLLN